MEGRVGRWQAGNVGRAGWRPAPEPEQRSHRRSV